VLDGFFLEDLEGFFTDSPGPQNESGSICGAPAGGWRFEALAK
jgi:hypothetical protein